MFYANSGSQLLLDHLKAVSKLAENMAIRLGLSKTLIEACRVAGLWHDMGKVIPSFQKYLQKQIGDGLSLVVDDTTPEDLYESDVPRHQEIGWAFVGSKLSHDYALQAIYWSHARHIRSDYDYYRDRDEIFSSLSPADIQELENLWKQIGCAGQDPLKILEVLEVPAMYRIDGSLNKNTNAEMLLVRSIVISADRYVSAVSDTECSHMAKDSYDMSALIDNLLAGGIHGSNCCPTGYDSDRYGIQSGCAQSSKDNRTTIVKAPAGFGKTMIGILWSLLRGGRTVWVCPRNAVVDAVYENIIREVEALGLSCSVERYRTGKRQDGYHVQNVPEFGSDIVVTNIDAVLSPMVNNRTAGRMFGFFGSNIILDEFHEFVSDSPLFAAFITYMRARHRVANNCHTLLLSATPMNMHKMWDTSDRVTTILPDGKGHYPAAHNRPYEVDFGVDFPKYKPVPGELTVSNSVRNAQENYERGYDILIHHGYTDIDRKNIEDLVKNVFGKTGTCDKSLAAALVVQAAMDISFRILNDSLCSPESSLQRIGRLNRWGKEDSAKIHFLEIGNKSEGGAIRTVYDADLRSLWIKHLKESLQGKAMVTLDELYVIYNDFYKVHDSSVFEYIKNQYKCGLHGPDSKRSFLGLIEFYPINIPTKASDRKNSSKNLRSPEGSYFFSVWDRNNKVWLGPEEVMSEGSELYQRYIGEEKLTVRLLHNSEMLSYLKDLVKVGYTGHQLRVKKGILPSSLPKWFQMARCADTPLPDFSRHYDHKLGLIDLRIGKKTPNTL